MKRSPYVRRQEEERDKKEERDGDRVQRCDEVDGKYWIPSLLVGV